jgi:hypothetical protein
MGNIIAFPSNAQRRRDAKPPVAGGAEILFFLGVRYARMTDAPLTASNAPKEGCANSNRNKKRKHRA